VSPGGMVEIVYSAGCKVEVDPGAVTTIAASPPCGPPSQQAVAVPPPDNDAWAIGGTAALAVTALGVAIYAVQNNNNNNNCGCNTTPASP
jgi:hypothetical protein